MTNKKSNKALRAALVLCVLALFCAAFVGATFAKYVTADDAADTARAAKWGVSVSMGGTLFGTDYEANSAAATADKVTADTSANVHADTNIVAPGTKSDKGIIITLDGKPEVAYDITTAYADIEDIYLGVGYWGAMVKVYDVTEDNFVDGKYYTLSGTDFTKVADLTAYKALAADTQLYELRDDVQVDAAYYPIVWTLDSTVNGSNSKVNYTSLADLMTALDESVNSLDKVEVEGVPTEKVNANVEFKAKYTITWDWAFTVDDASDKKDTVIGNLIENVLTPDQNPEMVPVFSSDNAAWSVASDDVDYPTSGVAGNCNLDINFNYEVTITQVN